MSGHSSNFHDTPLRRFNAFWWGLAYFGLFGVLAVVLHALTNDAQPVSSIHKVSRLQLRNKVDASQAKQLAAKELAGTEKKVMARPQVFRTPKPKAPAPVKPAPEAEAPQQPAPVPTPVPAPAKEQPQTTPAPAEAPKLSTPRVSGDGQTGSGQAKPVERPE